MRPQATPVARTFPDQNAETARELARLRADIEHIAKRGTVRELGPGHIVVRVPFGKKRAIRRYLKVCKRPTIRYDIRWISLREHWTLNGAIVILNFRRRIMHQVGRVSRPS